MMSANDASATPTTTPEAATLGVVGAGLMGSGIAQVAALAGIDVRLFDAADGAVTRSLEKIESQLRRLVEKTKLSEEEATTALGRITPAATLAEVAACASVIEAVIEDLAVKHDIFRQLADHANDDTLLATNTSALPITDIAATCSRPHQVVGMHFFSPVPRMPLCELVRGYRTDDATLAKAQALAQSLGKETILVNRDDAGFVTSRLMSVLVGEAARIVEQGLATAQDVDRACELGFGHRMGPLATADLTGVDVAYRAARSIHESTGDPAYRPPEILRRMVSAGALGRKSGEGFYAHGEVR
jgi:3-hydroxybutyryl-CoA dehydrogenase